MQIRDFYPAALDDLMASRPEWWSDSPTESERRNVMELVGATEIAQMCDVHRVSVSRWKADGKLPAPEWVLACGPIWRKDTIDRWIIDTRRPR